jgi:hypothetical protein
VHLECRPTDDAYVVDLQGAVVGPVTASGRTLLEAITKAKREHQLKTDALLR